MISLATLNEAYLHSHFVHAGISGHYNQGRNGNFWIDMLIISLALKISSSHLLFICYSSFQYLHFVNPAN